MTNDDGETNEKRGRPTKFNDSVKEKILELAKQGKTDEEISEIIGICSRTLRNWKGAHSDFLPAIKESKAVADELVEASLFHRAVGYRHKATKFFQHEGCVITEDYIEQYPPDTKAAIFWLKNRQPEKWRDKAEVEHSGNLSLQAQLLNAIREVEDED